jgi:NitT/TauT family transport system permease protein
MTSTAADVRSRGKELRRQSKATTQSVIVGTATLVVFLALWEILPTLGVLNRVLIPTVSDTIWGLGQLIIGGYWWEDLASTLSSVLIAWTIGVAFGITMGVVLGTSPFVRTAITPYAIALQALPKIVLAPVLIGALGFGPESKIAIAVAICFFPVWINTMVGLSLPSAAEFTFMRSLNATRVQLFRKLQMPSAVPIVLVGMKHAMLLSFTGVLVAEILSSASNGLGKLVKEFSIQLNMPLTLAVITVVLTIAVSLVSIMDVLERKAVFWSESERGKKS